MYINNDGSKKKNVSPNNSKTNLINNNNNNNNNHISEMNKNHMMMHNNYLTNTISNNINNNNNNPNRKKNPDKSIINLHKMTFGKNININTFVNKPNNIIIKRNERGMSIKRTVLNSLTYFTNFNNFYLQRNAYDIFELKSNFMLKSLIIQEKEILEKQTLDELKILENEIQMEKENRLAIEMLNKNIFNFDRSQITNKNSNNKIKTKKKNSNSSVKYNKSENSGLKNNLNNSINSNSSISSICSSKNDLQKSSILFPPQAQKHHVNIGESNKDQFLPIMENDEDSEDLKNKANGKKKFTELKKSIEIKIDRKYSKKYSSDSNHVKTPIIQTKIENTNSLFNSYPAVSKYGDDDKNFIYPILKKSNGTISRPPPRRRMTGFDSKGAVGEGKLNFLGTNNLIVSAEEKVIKFTSNRNVTAGIDLDTINNTYIHNSNINHKRLGNNSQNKIKLNKNNNRNFNIINSNLQSNLMNGSNFTSNNLLTSETQINNMNIHRSSRGFDKSLETLLLSENKHNQLNSEARKMPKNIFEADKIKGFGSKITNSNIGNLNNIKNINSMNSVIKKSFFRHENKELHATNSLENMNSKLSKIIHDKNFINNLGETQIPLKKLNNKFSTDNNIAEELRKHNFDIGLFDGIKQSVLNSGSWSEKFNAVKNFNTLIEIPEEIQLKIQNAMKVNDVKNTLEWDKNKKLDFDEKEEFSGEEDENESESGISESDSISGKGKEKDSGSMNKKNSKKIYSEKNKISNNEKAKKRNSGNNINNNEAISGINNENNFNNKNLIEDLEDNFDYNNFNDSLNQEENQEREFHSSTKITNIVNSSNKTDHYIEKKKNLVLIENETETYTNKAENQKKKNLSVSSSDDESSVSSSFSSS